MTPDQNPQGLLPEIEVKTRYADGVLYMITLSTDGKAVDIHLPFCNYIADLIMEQKTPAPTDEGMKKVLGELAGSASLCWSPKPTGVFDSSAAAGFVDKAAQSLSTPPTISPLDEDDLSEMLSDAYSNGEGEHRPTARYLLKALREGGFIASETTDKMDGG